MAPSRIFYPIKKPVDHSGNEITKPERVIYTRGLWADNSGELKSFYTSSLQTTSSRQYYYEVWNSASLDCGDESRMFSVAYGNRFGSGSLSQGGEASDTPSKSVYSQYRLMCLDADETVFTMANGQVLDDIYVVNLNRSRVGDKLDPGNFEINIHELTGGSYANNVYTGSNVNYTSNYNQIRLIDDSQDSNDNLGYGGVPSPVRNLVSGTIAGGIYNPSAPHYYGLVYADTGTIIISANSLNISCSFNTVTGSNINGNNPFKLIQGMAGSAFYNDDGFIARAVDVKEQDFYFVRVDNGLLNYSNNPTYVSGSDGFLSNGRFANEPATFITSIGLYDDAGQLLAVAKASQPIKKTFNSELSITVKLEY